MSRTPTADTLITYRDVLTNTPGPFALYLIEDQTTHVPHVSWILKTDRAVIDALGPTPLIEFRLGAFQVGRVIVVVLLMRIGHTPTLFESWINGYNPSGDGLRVMHLLQSQSHFTIHVFNEHAEEQRAIGLDNPSPCFFQRCAEQMCNSPVWTMDEFDAAKEKVCATYPSTSALWDALQT